MPKKLIMMVVLALNGGLTLQASGEPVKEARPSIAAIAKSLDHTKKCTRPDCKVFLTGYRCPKGACAILGRASGGALYCGAACASKDLSRHLEADACFTLYTDAK